MTTILAKLEKGHWVATKHDVETLAHERYTNAAATAAGDGSYLRIVLVAAQSKLGRPRGRGTKPNIEAQLAVLTAVHELFYAAVLRGVTTPDIAIEPALDTKEQRRRSLARNSRSAFARTAVSTLTTYVRLGGDLRPLDPATVTKGGLRAAMAPPTPTDKVARQIETAQGALLRALARRARDNPDEARAAAEAAVEALQTALDAMDAQPPAPQPGQRIERRRATDVGPARTRVGVPQFHRGAVS